MIVYWKVEGEELTIELQGKTNGWVGMYFSGGRWRPGMKNADITLASMIDGEPYVADHYSKNTYTRSLDERQDVTAVSGEERDGWTAVQFTKTVQKDPCDGGNDDCFDVVLTDGAVNLCVALANSDMSKDGSSYAYHSWRSTRNCEVVNFFEDSEKRTADTTTKKPAPKSNCVDKYKFCPKWAELGYCTSYGAFMNRNCKISCKQCF